MGEPDKINLKAKLERNGWSVTPFEGDLARIAPHTLTHLK